MAKFYGNVGYAIMENTRPGVYQPKLVEIKYKGDVVSDYTKVQYGNKVNEDVELNNKISIVADPFAYQNFQSIRYVEYMGTKWRATNIEVNYPRLIITLGGVYNGTDHD